MHEIGPRLALSPFARTGHKLLANGYSPLPITPGTKACHVRGWTEFCGVQPSSDQVSTWAEQSDSGIGVAMGGGFIGLDIDTDDEEILAAIRDVIPESIVAKRGAKGRTDFYNDQTQSIPARKFKDCNGRIIVEILAHGNQSVIPPTLHPKTGKPYDYLTSRTLEDTTLEELPEPPADLVEQLERTLAPFLPPQKDPDSSRRPTVPPKCAEDRPMRTWADSALRGETTKVAAAQKGSRNLQLFNSTCALGRYVHNGVLSEVDLTGPLLGACDTNGLLREDGRSQCIATIRSALTKAVDDELPDLERRAAHAGRHANRRPAPNPCTPGAAGIGHNSGAARKYKTELEMAQAVANEFGNQLKFDHDLKKWFYWDDDVWQLDSGGYVFCKIQDFCSQHDGTKESVFSSLRGIRNVEKIVLNQQGIAVTQAQWDGYKFILGCRHGYVDLETGEVIPPDPSYYITKLASAVPERGRPSLWLQLLDFWTNGDAGLIGFLQQMCGYMLTGDTSEQRLFFLRGPSATGKGTFVSVIQEILRDYAVTGDERMLAHSGSTKIDEALASARGARMYVFDELPRGFRVNDALLKRISGESVLTARQLFGERFDYLPTYKVILISNYDPGIPPDSDALKRRMVVIPFEQKAENIDTALRERLRREHAQILNWMIEGAADWRKNGFKMPAAVKATGEDYFSTQDTIGQFIEERCIVDPAAKEPAGALYEAWVEWCKARGHQPGTATTFGIDLGRRGFNKCWINIKKVKVRGRSGIQLRK